MPKATRRDHAKPASGVRPNIGMQFAFAFRALADRHAELLEEGGAGWLKPSHAYLLHAVADEPLSVKQLSELMQVSKQAMSIMVDHLEQRGLLTRTINAEDRRTRDIAISDLGLELLQTANEAWRRVEAEVSDLVGEVAYSTVSQSLDAYLASRATTAGAKRWRPVW